MVSMAADKSARISFSEPRPMSAIDGERVCFLPGEYSCPYREHCWPRSRKSTRRPVPSDNVPAHISGSCISGCPGRKPTIPTSLPSPRHPRSDTARNKVPDFPTGLRTRRPARLSANRCAYVSSRLRRNRRSRNTRQSPSSNSIRLGKRGKNVTTDHNTGPS